MQLLQEGKNLEFQQHNRCAFDSSCVVQIYDRMVRTQFGGGINPWWESGQ
jgi:hypothetical protein